MPFLGLRMFLRERSLFLLLFWFFAFPDFGMSVDLLLYTLCCFVSHGSKHDFGSLGLIVPNKFNEMFPLKFQK